MSTMKNTVKKVLRKIWLPITILTLLIGVSEVWPTDTVVGLCQLVGLCYFVPLTYKAVNGGSLEGLGSCIGKGLLLGGLAAMCLHDNEEN